MSNIHHTGVESPFFRSSSYDPHKPRVETTMFVDRDELTLAHLSHLIEKTYNFSEDTKVTIHKDRVTVVQESNKPVTSEDLAKMFKGRVAPVDDPNDLPPRDEKGRFTKRK